MPPLNPSETIVLSTHYRLCYVTHVLWQVEHHSSEEELEPLTGCWRRDECASATEKRKWSQVARLSLTDSGEKERNKKKDIY